MIAHHPRPISDLQRVAIVWLKRIREEHFVMEDLADPVTVELVTSTQYKVSLWA